MSRRAKKHDAGSSSDSADSPGDPDDLGRGTNPARRCAAVGATRCLPEQLAGALNLQMESGRQLGTILVEQGLLDHRSLTRGAGHANSGCRPSTLRTVQPSAEALAYVKEEMARRLQIVPLRLTRRRARRRHLPTARAQMVHEALSRLDVDARQHLPRPSRRRDHQSQHLLPRAVARRDDSVKQFWDSAAAKQQEIDAVIGATDEAPIIQLVNKIVTQALRDRALRHPHRADRRSRSASATASTARCARC